MLITIIIKFLYYHKINSFMDTLLNHLKTLGISYISHSHPAVFTVEQSKKLKLAYTGKHTKSLFIKDTESRYYLVCMSAEKKLDTKNLRKHLNAKDLRFASKEELFKILKLTPGSVSIFGLVNDNEHKVHLLLDRELWEADSVGFHPNTNTQTLEFKHEDLRKFYDSLPNKKEILEL